MIRHFALLFAIAGLTAMGFAQDTQNRDKSLDVQSPAGDLHVGKDADAQKTGLPLYPGAQPQSDGNNDPLNFGLFTESFGLKLVVAKYRSDDAPDKILDFYRKKMKKYGPVLECHGFHSNVGIEEDSDQPTAKPLKCDDDQTGPVRELKVGTEANAHVVSVEPVESGKGSKFTLVYLHKREKQGEI